MEMWYDLMRNHMRRSTLRVVVSVMPVHSMAKRRSKFSWESHRLSSSMPPRARMSSAWTAMRVLRRRSLRSAGCLLGQWRRCSPCSASTLLHQAQDSRFLPRKWKLRCRLRKRRPTWPSSPPSSRYWRGVVESYFSLTALKTEIE